MTALESLEWLERPPMVEDIDQNDQEEIIEPQVSENRVQSCPEIMTHLEFRRHESISGKNFMTFDFVSLVFMNLLYTDFEKFG